MDASPPPPDTPDTYFVTPLNLWRLKRSAPLVSRGSALTILGLSVAWLLLWIAFDRWDAGPGSTWVADGVPLLPWYALAVLALAALLRMLARPAPAFGSALILTLALVPLPLLVSIAEPYLDTHAYIALALLGLLYCLAFFAFGLRNLTRQRQTLAACAGVVFVAGFVWLSDRLDVIPDLWQPTETAADAPKDPGADAESLLFEQAGRIDEALAAMRVEATPAPKAFFVGFAGVGEQRVFAQEIGLASRVLGERYGMTERRLSLINDERDLEQAPLASGSALKYALQGLAERMNPARDVLFLSISSHGAKDPAIAVSNSQLPFNDLTPEDLSTALDESGIKWRVIIISACYAGAFIDSLKNPQTIVITAAAADRTSFGCSNDRDLTYFGEAFYRDALPGAASLRAAFDAAKSAITAREHEEHVDASQPQAYFGTAMETKLASMGTMP